MAEISSSEGGKKKGPGVKKGKKLSTRVDLTPMVDLGFLLITFFIFTTTMSQPTAMRLYLPKDTEQQDEQTKIKESGALTFLLGSNDNIYHYSGTLAEDESNLLVTNFTEVRDVIIDKKKTTDAEDFVVVIKPGPTSVYRNTVDLLDEMTINNVKRYALVDISEVELGLIQKREGPGQ